MPVKIVFGILSAAVDQQVFLLVYQIHDVPFADLVIRSHLDRHGRTSLCTESAEDAAGKINAEPGCIAPAVLPLGSLHGDAVHRAGGGAQIAGNAALSPVRIAGQHYPRPESRERGSFLLRILDG